MVVTTAKACPDKQHRLLQANGPHHCLHSGRTVAFTSTPLNFYSRTIGRGGLQLANFYLSPRDCRRLGCTAGYGYGENTFIIFGTDFILFNVVG